jgi:hypothetical protein
MIGALFNAAIHKYLFVTELCGHGIYKLPRVYINCLMFITQFVWPLSAGICTWNFDIYPPETLAKSKEVNFKYINLFHLKFLVVSRYICMDRGSSMWLDDGGSGRIYQ